MKHRTRPRSVARIGTRLALAAVGLTLALGACLIDERKYDQQLADCTYYCDQVEARCVDPNKIYDRPGACMAVCLLMDPGEKLGASDQNTLACRIQRLQQQDFEPATDCAQVGPGGNGVCGTNCEALCTLRSQVCGSIEGQSDQPDVVSYEQCLHNCQALPDLGNFNATRDRAGDSVQCRLIHVAESAISPELAVQHCPHTQTIPVIGETVPCSDPKTITKEVDCQKYCDVAMGACQGDHAVYESPQQCAAVCRLLDQGEPGDQSFDTVRCRRYHSYAALGNADEHCTHAGPTGDGHCGSGNCPDYCRIARQACPTAFAQQFPADTDPANLTSCTQSCSSLDGASANSFRDRAQRYTVHPPPAGNTLLCRTYHAIVALAASDDSNECAAAFGAAGSACQ